MRTSGAAKRGDERWNSAPSAVVAPATVWTRRLIELMEKVVSAGAGGAWDSGGRKATAWWSGAAING